MTADDRLAIEDVLSCIGLVPVLVTDIVVRLRRGEVPSKRRWSDVRLQDVEAILRARDVPLRCRPHGAGVAVYSAAHAFEEVETRYGVRPVRPYGRK